MTDADLTDLTERPPERIYRSLTVITPVYNERTTVAEVIRRMRAVELPVVLGPEELSAHGHRRT